MSDGLPGWLVLVGLVTAAGTWLVRRYALSRNLLDHPGERRSHHSPTPRGGGAGIVMALLAAALLMATRTPQHALPLGLAMLGLAIVAVIGGIDDHRPLSPWLRLAFHAIAGILLSFAVVQWGGDPAQALVGFVAAMVLVNVWNFMDGIDGLAASQAALVALFVALTTESSLAGWLSWTLLAACLGFLPFNFPKARVFLGDVGSGALGYVLATLLAFGYRAEPAQAWILLPLSAFLLDAALTLLRRIVRGEQWWTAHVGHLYQRLARSWGGHAKVTLAFAAWTLLGMGLALWLQRQEAAVIICAALAWYLAGASTWKLAANDAHPN